MGPHRIPDLDRQDQRRGAFRLSEIYARSHCGRTSATPHRRVASLELPAVKLKPQCLPDTAYGSHVIDVVTGQQQVEIGLFVPASNGCQDSGQIAMGFKYA